MRHHLLTEADLVLSRDAGLLTVDSHAPLRPSAKPELMRLRRGVYVKAESRLAASPRERYLQAIHAAVATREYEAVVAYQSAAALWSFPRVGPWPTEVHLVRDSPSALHSRNGVRFHNESVDSHDLAQIDGVCLTSRLRTLVDVARTDSFADAVTALDGALHEAVRQHDQVMTSDALLELLERTVSRRGIARAADAIAFARPEAANAGESLSRVLIHRLGFARPELQSEHPNPRGGRYFTDFEWPEARVIGEFDGRSKYLKPEYLQNRSSGEAVVEEKIREDDLRAEGCRFVRWLWDDIRNPTRFAALLVAAGVPREPARRLRRRAEIAR